MKIREILDHVFEVETYTKLNAAAAEERAWEHFGGGGCTCAVRTLENGDTLVGRNMDLTISNKPAYVVRTNCGKHRTVGLAYSYFSGPSCEDARSNGISDEFAEMLPFLCCDVLNDRGLYVEINMRSGEHYPDGSSKFGCTGTNPDAAHRVCSMNLTRYIGENCGSIAEALEYVRNELNLYTPMGKDIPWNFTFILAEKGGRHGLLEIAENRISWLEGQSAQANFYITGDFYEKQELKCGLGRYDLVTGGLEDVGSEEDFFALMDRVSYYQVYEADPQYDVRSEYVGVEPHWTIDYVLAEENREEISRRIAENIKKAGEMSRKEMEEAVLYWESVFTVVANVTKGTIQVRFFEDNDRMLHLSIG